jgi:hypothetical protein
MIAQTCCQVPHTVIRQHNKDISPMESILSPADLENP